jgi:hypothetical protein
MMKVRNIFILLLISLSISAQDKNISLHLREVLFRDLADTIERTIPVKIYYSNKWVDSLYLDVNSDNESVSGFLNKSLLNSGLTFIITDDNKVIISKGYTIKTNFLKEYRESVYRRATAPDTIKYVTVSRENEESNINDEYRVFKIGSLSASKKPGNAHLFGSLKAAGTEEPVSGATVYIEKLKIGVLTNNAGYYSFDIPRGQYKLEFRMVGMKSAIRNIIVYSDGKLDVNLEEDTNALDEVVVSAARENNIREVVTGIEKVSIKMINLIPMGLGEADLLKSSLLLPGVQTAGEASTGFNIRGGSIDQNLILFDGASIINPSHFFGFFSAFNSDIIQDVTLYKSGIPARYGGRVSSVMDITLKEGSMEKINVSGGFSPFIGRLMIEGPVVKNKLSFILSGRTTYSDWVLSSLNNEQLQKSSAGFNDIQGLLTFNINSKNSLSLSGYISNDNFNLFMENTIWYKNLSSTLKWNHRYNEKLTSQFAAIVSNYDYRIDSNEEMMTASSLKYKLDQSTIRADFTYRQSVRNKIEFGLDATGYYLLPGDQVPLGRGSEVVAKSLGKDNGIEPSLYITDEFEYSDKLTFSGGLRFTMFMSLGPRTNFLYTEGLSRSAENIYDTISLGTGKIDQVWPRLEYRFSSRYIITPYLSVKGGIQRNYQYLNMISNTTSMAPTDIWKLSNSYIKPQRGDQIALGVYRNFSNNNLELSTEVYYKILRNIIDYKGGAELLMNEHLETDILNAKGKAYGMEIMLKKQSGNVTGWISYAYARSFLKIDSEFEEEKVNGGRYFPADIDKPHDFKFVTNIKILRRFNVSANMVYNTGRPITYPVGYFNFYNVNRVFYSERNAFRIPDYLRLDLSATVNGNLKARKLNHSSLTFSVYNVLGRKNPYSIFFKVEDGKVNGYQMSIIGRPVFMLIYNFRIRGNASTDF